MVLALCILWKFETFDHWKSDRRKDEPPHSHSHCPNVWRPCLKQIHPAWLLLYRVVVFGLLLATLIIKCLINGGRMFYFYTQWTFTLITIYFGFGSLLSAYGCYKYHQVNSRGYDVHSVETEGEQGYYTPLTYGENKSSFKMREVSNRHSDDYVFQGARTTCYLFQVLFQMNVGAVMLTDVIYWSIIFPFLTIKDYSFNFMTINMHTFNLVVLLGDAALNCLKLPWFGIAYVILWTGGHTHFLTCLHIMLQYGTYSAIVVVSANGIDAYSLLRNIRVTFEDETFLSLKKVPSDLSVFVIKREARCSVTLLYSGFV
ncbi:hypothetical protein ACFE04_010359 [Oxalis oulophora]